MAESLPHRAWLRRTLCGALAVVGGVISILERTGGTGGAGGAGAGGFSLAGGFHAAVTTALLFRVPFWKLSGGTGAQSPGGGAGAQSPGGAGAQSEQSSGGGAQSPGSVDVAEVVAFQLVQLVGLSMGGTGGADDYWAYAAFPAYFAVFAVAAFAQ